MPRLKSRKKKKAFFRLIHLHAIIFLVVYSIISKTIFVKSLATKDPVISFLGPYIFGVIAGMILLYILNHEEFFHFIKDVENVEGKKEKRLIRKYKHFGKIVGTLIIAAVGGPIFSALTIRLLLNNLWYKYLLIAVGCVFSTLLTVGIGFSVLNLI